MRESIKQFVKICAEDLPVIEPIYEFGSLQVPGQEGFADIRPIFPKREYVGCDMRDGPGVDKILNLHHIDLPSESVGTVLILDTLEHVEFPREAIKEVYRILKPNGLIVISSVMDFPIHDYPYDYWRFTPEAFKSLLKPFNKSFVDFLGEEDFPHTVLGVGFKGNISEEVMKRFSDKVNRWKKRHSGTSRDLSSPFSEKLGSKRYEPTSIDLDSKNSSQGLIIEMVGRDKKILEVGPSTGYITKILKSKGNEVVCIEIDKEAAEKAKRYCDKMVMGDVETLDLDSRLKPNQFDVIIFGDVLEHLKSPNTVLKKVKKYLKPDGYVVASIPNIGHGDVILNLLNGKFTYTSKGLLDITHLRFFTLGNVKMMLDESGYNISELNTTNIAVGHTELGSTIGAVPPPISNFIKKIPFSDVYQFVIKAYPKENRSINEIEVPMVDISSLPIEEIQSLKDEIEGKERRIKSLEDIKLIRLHRKLSRMRIKILLILGLFKTALRNLVLVGPVDTIKKTIDYIGTRRTGGIQLNEQYQAWLEKNRITTNEIKRMNDDINKLKYLPKISIVTPVYNVDEVWLRNAIDSVRSQIYENWELCMVDDASTKEHIKPVLEEYSKKDKRIKVGYLKNNRHISGASNEALKLATGEFVAFLDHDDEITLNALYEVVKLLNEHPDADMIYSDEDKIGVDGNLCDPFFKPDWSPDLFMSCMYTCHLGVYRKRIIEEIGGFRGGYEGSQDYDLVLRFTERTPRIYHIPKVLYHWRKIPTSTAFSPNAKNYAYDAAKKALKGALHRRGWKGTVTDSIAWGTYRVRMEILGNPKVSIIIPTKDKAELLKKCIGSIKKTDYTNYEIIVVDNNSEDKETIKYLTCISKRKNVRVLKYENLFNFSAINNFAAKHASGEYLLFLNNDTEVISKEWLSAMLEHSQRKEVGAVGAKLLYPDGKIQHAGLILGLGGVAGYVADCPIDRCSCSRLDSICNYSAVTGACMMVRKEVFEEVGGFDEKNLTVAFNDIDLCLRIRERGYLIVYTPYAKLYHHESASRGYEDTLYKLRRFKKECEYMKNRGGSLLKKDPYYNPNLTLERKDFSLKI